MTSILQQNLDSNGFVTEGVVSCAICVYAKDVKLLTAGYPSICGNSPHQCYDMHFKLICHHEYETTVPHVWCMNGVPVEHDGREFAINHDDRSITLMNVSRSRYGERNTSFQCCVNLTGGPRVCGEQYIFDPLGEEHAYWLYSSCQLLIFTFVFVLLSLMHRAPYCSNS